MGRLLKRRWIKNDYYELVTFNVIKFFYYYFKEIAEDKQKEVLFM